MMRCPACPEAVLVMADRQGVEIDYCPNCRGVWLDRGELDKIIERSAVGAGSAGSAPAGRDDRGRSSSRDREHLRDDDDDDDRDDRDDRDRRHPQRRKRGFLSELFDFD